MSAIEPGLTNETTRPVAQRDLASKWGSGLAAVLATPVLVAFCEECARLAVDPLLPAGKQTVGTWISLRHLAATPPGLTVNVEVRLEEVDGRRLVFSIVADDGIDKISQGTHERFIIDAAKFNAKVFEKGK